MFCYCGLLSLVILSGLGRDQGLGIPVVSSCMAPPSITAIREGVLIVARAPASLTHVRARGTAQPNSDAGGVLLFVDPREAKGPFINNVTQIIDSRPSQ